MKSIKHIVFGIVAISALLGLFSGSAIAQVGPPKFDKVTVTILNAVDCKRCAGRGFTNGRTGDTGGRDHIYVEIKKNHYGVPCTACGGKRGKGKKRGTGKRPIKYSYFAPRGTKFGKLPKNVRIKIKPVKITRPKTKNRTTTR